MTLKEFLFGKPGDFLRFLFGGSSGGASSAPTVLQKGSQGDSVEQAQDRLNRQGASLNVDGKFGPKTDAAVRKYQRDNGLVEDGVIGKHTRKSLGL